MLWLQKLMRYDETGKAYWEVVDVLILPRMKKNGEIIDGLNGCKIRGRFDSEIVAIAKSEEGSEKYLTKIRFAWRANLRPQRFQRIPTKGIMCSNPIYGV